MTDNKIQASWRCTKDLKADLENFAHYSRKTESEVIAEALQHYFQSDKAFVSLLEEDKARREFFRGMDEEYPYMAPLMGELLKK